MQVRACLCDVMPLFVNDAVRVCEQGVWGIAGRI